jgi:hypothetical protein
MDVRRGVAAGLVGLALLAGTTGCSKIGEKVAEEAIEKNSDCKDVDINTDEGGFAGNCGGNDVDANLAGDAELPSDWPADLEVPEGLMINVSNGTDTPIRSLSVIGSLDGDVATIYEMVKTQLTAAGFTIDNDSLADGPTGPTGNLSATGTEFTAAVVVSAVDTALEGNVTVTYSLNAVG